MTVFLDMQIQMERLGAPYDDCIDSSTGKHDVTRNVYEELFPDTYYSVAVRKIY